MMPVRAAGGVLWRPSDAGSPLVCVVHRPRYDDWSLPKGKLAHTERPLLAAVREVWEETGVRGRPELRLPRVTYELPGGVPKTVDFWLMRACDGAAAAPAHPAEVDAVAWLPVVEAQDRLSYPDEVGLLRHAAGLQPVTTVLPLVRHAHAGRREEFRGEDALRPLDERGRAEAAALADALAVFVPRRLISAAQLRCRQTLQPLADRLGLPIVSATAFTEPDTAEERADRAATAAHRVRSLLTGPTTVVCSQGKVIPPMLAMLDVDHRAAGPKPYHTPKGTGWLLSFSGDRLVGLSRL